MSRKVTMKQLAEQAGVSINAVSLVLNNKPGVSEGLSKKILQLAEESGYLDQTQRYTKTFQSHNICVLTKKEYARDMHFYTKIIYGIESEANRKGYDVFVQFTDEKEEIPNCIMNHKVAGLIIVGMIDEEWIERLKAYRLPTVIVDHASFQESYDCILSDNRMGGHTAAEYLLRQGYTKIGFFGDLSYSHSIKERFWGYVEAVTPFGKKQNLEKTFRGVQNYSVLGEVEQYVIKHDVDAIIAELSSLKELPEVFFCSNDFAAVNVCKALQKMGYRIPEDIGIVGFDDDEFCKMMTPMLTTLHVEKTAMGKKAFGTLLWRIQNRKSPTEKVLMPVNLVERESVIKKRKEENED